MATSKEMTAGPALPLILKFTLPLLLGNLLQQTYSLVDAAIVDDPPYLMRDGGMIKDGYNETVDNYRHAKTEGKQWLSELEASEREKTGIKNMKVKYNKVFGYYLEVTNSFKDLVPDYYTRKQTLTNAERYITPRLKELEDTILGAEDKLYALEYDLFCTVRDTVAGEAERIQRTAQALARLDVYASLSYVAEHNHYVRPKLNSRGKIDIKDGRHPVVEKMIPNDMFIANDTLLDNGDHRVSVITGPNMAGKSTYMRQNALIALSGNADKIADEGRLVLSPEASSGAAFDNAIFRLYIIEAAQGFDDTILFHMLTQTGSAANHRLHRQDRHQPVRFPCL